MTQPDRRVQRTRALLRDALVEQLRERLPQSTDSLLLLERLRDWYAKDIAISVRAAFTGGESTFSIDVLAHYLAGAQITLLHWWLAELQSSTPTSSPRRATTCNARLSMTRLRSPGGRAPYSGQWQGCCAVLARSFDREIFTPP